MKKTENTKATTNNDLQIIGKKIKFCINNDIDTELTKKACLSFIEWLKTSQNSSKYINKYGIIAGGWCINLSDVIDIYHICTAYDSITGGMVDVLYITFENPLLNRIVYMDNEILKRGTILLPIDETVQNIPFSFKYQNQRKTTARKTKTEKTNTTKSTKTPTTPTKTKTPKTTEKTTAEKVNK